MMKVIIIYKVIDFYDKKSWRLKKGKEECD